ncbi:MAG TPA: hypothetical protein VG326_02650 [Tepidisphaeraceae bacterium]|jgi:hypothetical protein|nr:hypothetical protein [Tepidisphaeraceae bacterium]
MSENIDSIGHSLPPEFKRARHVAGAAGIAGTAACLLAWIIVMIFANRWPQGAASFYKAWLFAWLFFLGISLGSLSAVMLHHLTGGQWGYFIRRPGEAAANVLPLLFVLFVPICFGLGHIYPWADPHYHNEVVRHQHRYLNAGFFVGRYIAYFAVWIVMAWLLRTLSLRYDHTGDERTRRRLYAMSAAGIPIYFVTMSLAAIDWIMSMEPGWYSTVFGFIMCMGQAIAGISTLIIVLLSTAHLSPIVERLRPRHLRDLATLLVTVVILWAYNAFSQLLIVWMGNIQGDIPWYVKRTVGPWRIMADMLILFGFGAPFVLLLQRGVKQKPKAMSWLCAGLLLMRLIELFWTVAPGGADLYPKLHWFNVLMSAVALIGIGGLWIAAFLMLLDGPSLLPAGDAVPIEVIASDEPILQPRVIDHGSQSGAQPGIA